MVLGFNHNVTYKGQVFHVQTEDSGVKNPHIITLLYRGGVILCSKKTSYADIVKMDCLHAVVEDLMKEQHKDMMRRLKSGEFDEKAFSIDARLIENYEIPVLEPEKGLEATNTPTLSAEPLPPPDIPEKPALVKTPIPAEGAVREVLSLDDAILSFFDTSDPIKGS